MGTRTYSRRGVLTAAGRRRAGLEAIDIFGNRIPDRGTVPVPARPAAVQPQPVAPAPEPVPTATRRTRTPRVAPQATPQATPTVSWSPYADTSVYNPALLPGDVQQMIKGGGDDVFNNNDFGSRDAMAALGLDKKNRGDCQIYADLMSSFVPSKGVRALRSVGRDRTNGGFYISNAIFKTNKLLTPNGTGYAMVARQIAAAQEIANRTGKTFTVIVHAVGNNESEDSMSGCSVWPKLGYEFPMSGVPSKTRAYLQQNGFNINQMETTADLMLSKNAAGQSGFDVWRDAIRQAGSPDMYGQAVVKPNGPLSMSQKVTQGYGKRKGFVKSKAFEAMFDDAVLRDVWMSMSK